MDLDALCKKHGIDRKKVDLEKVVELLKQGQRIEAITLVVKQSKAGLKKSKDLADDIMAQMG